MERHPLGVRAAVVLLAANSILWLAFSIFTATGAHPSFRAGSAYRWPAALLALAVAAALGVLALRLRAPSRLGYWLTVVALTAIVFSLLFDEFGLADLAVALMTTLPLVLLVKHRAWYLRGRAGEAHGIG